MRAIFAILASCLVAVNAGAINQAAVNYESMVNEVVGEIEQIAKDAAVALQHQVDEIIFNALNKIETAVESIEARRKESIKCVTTQYKNVVSIADVMHEEMNFCGTVAAKTSAEIMNDVNAATQQVIFDGYDIVHTYRRCQKYTNSTLKKSCYARLTIKATAYMQNCRKSIKTIRESTNERIPAVIIDLNECTHTAADSAIHELENVQAGIGSCIGKL